jgi:hypothetical protein
VYKGLSRKAGLAGRMPREHEVLSSKSKYHKIYIYIYIYTCIYNPYPNSNDKKRTKVKRRKYRGWTNLGYDMYIHGNSSIKFPVYLS